MMRVSLSAILLCGLLAIGAPVHAAPPDNYLEADGCDVMVFVEALPSGTHTGSWLVESVFSGERYTYTYDQTSALLTVAPDGLTYRQVLYVAWRLEERRAKGTNRTEVRGSRADLTQILAPFDFDGQIIRGTRYSKGGIGGTGIVNLETGEVVHTAADLVFCRGGDDDSDG